MMLLRYHLTLHQRQCSSPCSASLYKWDKEKRVFNCLNHARSFFVSSTGKWSTADKGSAALLCGLRGQIEGALALLMRICFEISWIISFPTPLEADNPFFSELINLHFAWHYHTPTIFFSFSLKGLTHGREKKETSTLKPLEKSCRTLQENMLF